MSKKTIKKVDALANEKTKVEEKKKPEKNESAKVVETKIAESKKVVAKKVVEKPVVVEAKKEPKKIATKKAPEKISVKAEPKKIATAKAPEKIATAKAPEKIAAKPEPKKIATKKVEIEKPVVKEEVKKADTKTKVEVKKVEKNKETKKAIPKKPASKKAQPVKKEVVKKTKPKSDKMATLETYTLEECISYMQAMNVKYVYEDYCTLLLEESNLNVLEKNILEGNKIKDLHLRFDEVGYDEDLIMVTLQKVADTMDVKAMDYKELKQSIQKAMKFKLHKDGEVNAAQYLDEFKVSEKLLMIGQRKNLVSASEVSTLIGTDVAKFFQHFFTFAYELLPQWQYNDIKFYEDFAYAVLSQYADLYESDQLRVQMDVADLYIQHGDYQHGDDMYGYILRDNQIKDYIYYRYASIYKDIDVNKAISIAYSSLQYVDDRYTYFTDIMKIINN